MTQSYSFTTEEMYDIRDYFDSPEEGFFHQEESDEKPGFYDIVYSMVKNVLGISKCKH